MNNTEKEFLMMLKNYIDEKTDAEDISEDICGMDYEELFQLSRNHKVEAVIYDQTVSGSYKAHIPSDILGEMKSITIYSSACQIRNMSMLERVFSLFNEKGIPFIGLKGVVLRNLYKHPEYRTMCDADIVVHKEDLSKVKEELKALGYKAVDEESGYHFRFTHNRLPVIEVHWSITGNEELDNYAWRTACPHQFGQATVMSLNPVMQLCYIVMHMAHHVEGLGFGIRQLMDFAAFSKAYYKDITWEELREKAEQLNIYKFTSILFAASNRAFGTDIPEEFYSSEVMESPNVDLFIEDILNGGVYGRASEKRMLASSININFKDEKGGKIKSFTAKINAIKHQKDDSWLEAYPFAKKHKSFRGFAALRYLYKTRFNERKGFVNNVREFREASKLSKGQKSLKDWLELN